MITRLPYPSIPAGIDDTQLGSIDRIALRTGKVDAIVANVRTVIGTGKPVSTVGKIDLP